MVEEYLDGGRADVSFFLMRQARGVRERALRRKTRNSAAPGNAGSRHILN